MKKMEDALKKKSADIKKLQGKIRYYQHLNEMKIPEDETKEAFTQNKNKHNDNVRILIFHFRWWKLKLLKRDVFEREIFAGVS